MADFSALLKKYSVPGPRYTSYPTVPHWETAPDADQWVAGIARALDESLSRGIGSSIYAHIPFCQSLCTYCGCNTRITRSRAVGRPYVATVIRELDLYLSRLGRSEIPVTEIHLGGGTPTFLSEAELDELMSGIASRVKVMAGSEFSIEVDPRVTTEGQLKLLAGHGFRRISLGIQDFDPKVQEAVHRVQTRAQVDEITRAAREHGFTSVNYDLIYGLPFQTPDSVARTIETVRGLRPDRIAFYSYAHVPWIKASQRRFTEADLPDADAKRALYELGRAMLEESGYREIGMDHFALETDSLWRAAVDGSLHRNFMGYTSRLVAPLIGLGVSSIGDSWEIFAQNEKLLETYQARVEKGELPLLRGHILGEEDLRVRQHILDLMTRFETSWQGSSDPFLLGAPERLAGLAQDGIVELSPGRCRVTPEGRAFLRNVCMAFDARLARAAASDRPVFSKTV
jgi:oxygen-independent coproporphyrinogen-3 oxidase